MSLDLKALSARAAHNQIEEVSAKRPKVDHGRHYFEVTAENLFMIREDINKQLSNNHRININGVEIEVRLGMITDQTRRWRSKLNVKNAISIDDDSRSRARLQFKSGVDAIFARKMSKIFNSSDFRVETQPTQKLRCDDNNNRWQVDDEGRPLVDGEGKLLTSERKDVLKRLDVALLAHNYDIRMNCAYESNLGASDSSNLVKNNNWSQERTKRRVSCVHKVYGSWRVDFTEVDILFRSGGKAKEIEVEFELLEEPKTAWIQETDAQKVIQLTRKLAEDLTKLIDLFVPFDTEEGTHTEPMQLANSPELDAQLLATNAVIHVPSKKGFEFLGSMPVNLTRQNLASVVSSKYYLTEKSDGIRYLLYVVRDPATNQPVAVMVNRSKKAFRFRGSVAIGAMLEVGSILDGELVYNLTFRENVFLVFDVLAWAGKSYVNDSFSQRLVVIEQQVMASYNRGFDQRKAEFAAMKEPPILLVRKAFVDKSRVQDLLGKITLEGSDRVFKENPRRHHRSDGLIFQPDKPYVFSRNYDLLKWKWSELRSIDLEVVVDQSLHSSDGAIIHLVCSGDSGTQIDCTKRGDENIGLGTYDSLRLMADMLDSNGRMTGIAEVAYDVNVGMWEYLQLRSDKNEPNFIATVMGVFTEQAENIGVEELEYIITASAHGMRNDFEQQLNSMKTKLLKWQRETVAKQQHQHQQATK